MDTTETVRGAVTRLVAIADADPETAAALATLAAAAAAGLVGTCDITAFGRELCTGNGASCVRWLHDRLVGTPVT